LVAELLVAFACESEFDRLVYAQLASDLLGVPVTSWPSEFTFSGCKTVAALADAYLLAASRDGVAHALLAIDNDGGAVKAREHDDPNHVVPISPWRRDDDVSCRECWLEQAIPPRWTGKTCVVVPVQAIETWLLHLRGHAFGGPTPEHSYHRRQLKTLFFGKEVLSRETKIARAQELLSRPDALDRLRERASFQRFERRLARWS
jgi:hypothetical protein